MAPELVKAHDALDREVDKAMGGGAQAHFGASVPEAAVCRLRETHQQLTQRLFEHAAPMFWDVVHGREHDFPQRVQRTPRAVRDRYVYGQTSLTF